MILVIDDDSVLADNYTDTFADMLFLLIVKSGRNLILRFRFEPSSYFSLAAAGRHATANRHVHRLIT